MPSLLPVAIALVALVSSPAPVTARAQATISVQSVVVRPGSTATTVTQTIQVTQNAQVDSIAVNSIALSVASSVTIQQGSSTAPCRNFGIDFYRCDIAEAGATIRIVYPIDRLVGMQDGSTYKVEAWLESDANHYGSGSFSWRSLSDISVTMAAAGGSLRVSVNNAGPSRAKDVVLIVRGYRAADGPFPHGCVWDEPNVGARCVIGTMRSATDSRDATAASNVALTLPMPSARPQWSASVTLSGEDPKHSNNDAVLKVAAPKPPAENGTGTVTTTPSPTQPPSAEPSASPEPSTTPSAPAAPSLSATAATPPSHTTSWLYGGAAVLAVAAAATGWLLHRARRRRAAPVLADDTSRGQD